MLSSGRSVNSMTQTLEGAVEMTTETHILDFHFMRCKCRKQNGKPKARFVTERKSRGDKPFPCRIHLPLDKAPSLGSDSAQPSNMFSLASRKSKRLNRSTDSSLIVKTINRVAVAYRNMGLYEESRSLLEFGIQSFHRFNISSRLELATMMDNLSAVYSDLELFEQAENTGRRALSIREYVTGAHSHEVAVTLDNLGLICAQQEKYLEAKSLYERALSIFNQGPSSYGSDMAICLNNLATLHFNTGNHADARRHYTRAIAIGQETSGSTEPQLGIYYNNLAELHRTEGDIVNARNLFQKGLTILENCYGKHHPETALVMQNLQAISDNTETFFKVNALKQDFQGETTR